MNNLYVAIYSVYLKSDWDVDKNHKRMYLANY